MLKNFDHINKFLQRSLYFWQGCAGIQILGMIYHISHNTFFPNGTSQGLQIWTVLPRRWRPSNKEGFISYQSETGCQSLSLNGMTMQLSLFLQQGKQLLFPPPPFTRKDKLLFKHFHSTSLWGYPNLNKLLHWNVGTRKKIYFTEQRFMLKQTNKKCTEGTKWRHKELEVSEKWLSNSEVWHSQVICPATSVQRYIKS